MRKHPVKTKVRRQTSFCLAYDSDLEQAYSFYCARYENIRFKDFLNLGIREFNMKLASIPETEPLFKIIKSRVIELGKIKDKDERKYWSELKRVNKIPDVYLSDYEINETLRNYMKNSGGIKNGNRFK